MSRITAVLIMLILCGSCCAAAAQNEDSPAKSVDAGPEWDWLGVHPIYSYNGLLSPYYPYYYPTFGHSWKSPAYFYPTYLIQRFPASPWWIGDHGGLAKTMQIARSGSSVRIYYQGTWQEP